MARQNYVLNLPVFGGLRSQVARSVTIYLGSYAVSLGIPFLLLPVITRYIDPDGYGHLAMFQMLLTAVSGLVGFSLRDPIISVFSVKSLPEKARFLSSSLVIMTILFLIISAGTFLGRHALTNFTDLSGRWLLLAVLTAFAYVINQTNFTIMQADRRPLLYAAGQIFFSVLSAGISLFAVVGLQTGWSGRAVALALVAFASSSWGISRFVRCGLIREVRRESLVEAFTFGAATLPYMVSMLLASFTDRITLRVLFSFQDVGVYSVAIYLALGFAACGDAINLAVIPWAYRQLDRLNSMRDFAALAKRTVFLMVAMAAFAAVFFLLMREYASRFMPGRYTGVLVFLPWLVADAWCVIMFQTLSVVLFHYRKKAVLSWFGGAALLGSVILVYSLSMAYGPLGAAIGLFMTHFAMIAVLLPVTAFFVLTNLGHTRGAEAFP